MPLLEAGLVAVADRLIQLLGVRQSNRKALHADFVAPTFAQFEEAHRQYMESFASYRKELQQTDAPLTPAHALLARVRSDNIFSKHLRERLLQAGTPDGDERLTRFRACLRDYLVDVRVADAPVAGYRGRRFENPQHWRRTLIDELEAIFDERWAAVLDRNSARPPLCDPDDVRAAMEEHRAELGVPAEPDGGTEALKRALALRALDEVVEDMQLAYSRMPRRTRSCAWS